MAHAENVAPSVHWGAIDYPDLDRTLLTGLTVNRFTEFNGSGARFNSLHQTDGFNFATVSWTERIKALPGWNSNLTVGAGPTGENPSLELQNGVVHKLIGNNPVPVNQTRVDGDFMVGGSLTRWSALFGGEPSGFLSVGAAAGSLYQEIYGRIGLRHVSLAEVVSSFTHQSPAPFLEVFSRFVRFSAMGRYSRLYGGSAYHASFIATQSYLGQASISIGDYDSRNGTSPRWSLEFAATIDSGLFVTPTGHGIERRFGSIALHFPYGVFETWNDVLGKTDCGPTYGFRFMLDVLTISTAFSSRD